MTARPKRPGGASRRRDPSGRPRGRFGLGKRGIPVKGTGLFGKRPQLGWICFWTAACCLWTAGCSGAPEAVESAGSRVDAPAREVWAPPAPETPPQGEEEASVWEKSARALLAGMTLEEKVGQMFLARCPEEDAAQKAAEFQLGGYLLFARDFAGKTKEEVAQCIRTYQNAAELPMLIAVDEEGGAVNRVSRFPALRSEPFPSPQDLYRTGGLDAVRADTIEKCRLLGDLGIRGNLAPVCDVSQDPSDYIYPRTLGRSGAETAQYVQTVVTAMKQEGTVAALKHFPGYGGNGDTHTGVAYDDRPYESFLQSDFLPFQAGVDAGADMVLVCHNVVACMDSRYPASLSASVHEILREELGFTGVIVTDDLSMAGVRDFAGEAQAAVLAVQAGNDLLCSTDFEIQIPAVLEAVRQGTISLEQVDQSVLRILEMKLSAGILQPVQKTWAAAASSRKDLLQ